jgi:hypothetical protein
MRFLVKGTTPNPIRTELLEVEADSPDEARKKVAGRFIAIWDVTELPPPPDRRGRLRAALEWGASASCCSIRPPW